MAPKRSEPTTPYSQITLDSEVLPCSGSFRNSVAVMQSLSSSRQPSLAGPIARACPARNQHRQFQRLLSIQARVDLRSIRSNQVALGQASRSAYTLGHILARQLDVHAAEHRAFVVVNAKCGFDLAQNIVETPGLHAARRGLGVAVHGIAHPKHL